MSGYERLSHHVVRREHEIAGRGRSASNEDAAGEGLLLYASFHRMNVSGTSAPHHTLTSEDSIWHTRGGSTSGACLEPDHGCSYDHQTPLLHDACAHGDDQPATSTTVFLDARDIGRINSRGLSPLNVAVEAGVLRSVEALLHAGADVNHRYGNAGRHSALSWAAAFSQDTAILRALVRHEATDLTACGGAFKRNALHVSAHYNRPSSIDTLMTARTVGACAAVGAGETARAAVNMIESTSGDGFRPLHIAVMSGSCDAAAALLRHGADVGARDSLGRTPIILACSTSTMPEMADLLLRWGSDEVATDKNGFTAEAYVKTLAANNGGCTEVNSRTVKLLELLARAPADRAWRRRGLIVMCRAFPQKLQLLQGGHRRNASGDTPATTPSTEVYHRLASGIDAGHDQRKGREDYRTTERGGSESQGHVKAEGSETTGEDVAMAGVENIVERLMGTNQECWMFRAIVGFL